jgi:hypothetical protein
MQPRRGHRLAIELWGGLAVNHYVSGQDLRSDPATRRDTLGLVHHPHAALTDLSRDPIIA